MNSQSVKIDSANANTGDLHRAISLSKKLHDAGKWDGESVIVWKSATVVRDAIAENQLTGELPTAGWSLCGCGVPDSLCTWPNCKMGR
jgi:hypothetical protein